MRTNFTDEQLTDPGIKLSNDILRKCVHCGFCTATCPTFVILGDEADSPRGRITLIQNMLESGKPPTPGVVKHLDRCLSCLSCMTTCPSGVEYKHLIDFARQHVEQTFTRPLPERLFRNLLARLVPNPSLFRLALLAAPLARLLQSLPGGRLNNMVAMAPAVDSGHSPFAKRRVVPAEGSKRWRVALFSGCAQQVLRPAINQATIRLLARHGCEVVVVEGTGCCGAASHHLGRTKEALDYARANVGAWTAEADENGLDAIVFNASGCGVTLKDYGVLLAHDSQWAAPAARVASLCKDISEVMADLEMKPSVLAEPLEVAYHSACSMQHGLKLGAAPRRLLEAAGYHVSEPAEGHLCCGSAGTYNLLQPELAEKLLARKLASLHVLEAQLIATGNIGCLVHLASGAERPVVHSVELLDWATGGPRPPGM